MIVISKGLTALEEARHLEALRYMLSKSFGNDNLEIILSMRDMTQYFLFKNNKPVAVVSSKKRGVRSQMLYNIATSPYYRRRGYMKALLAFVIENSREKGFTALYLETGIRNNKAIDLYHAMGFYYAEPCDHGVCLMRLDL